jgi:hypothetical protein
MAKQKESTVRLAITLDLSDWHEDVTMKEIENKVVAELTGRLKEQVATVVRETVVSLADAEFKKIAKSELEKVLTKGFKKTNEYGEPIGSETSIREMLLAQFKEYISEPVDSEGRRESYSRNGSLTRSQYIINKMAHGPLMDAVQETVKKIGEEAKKQIQASVSKYIAEQLTPVIHVPQLRAPGA